MNIMPLETSLPFFYLSSEIRTWSSWSHAMWQFECLSHYGHGVLHRDRFWWS